MTKLILGACLALLFCLIGCSQSYLKPSSPNQFTLGNVLYEVSAYSPTLHQTYRIDPLFCELDMATVFFLRVTNLNDHPVKSSSSATFALLDNKQHSYPPIQHPFLPSQAQADERLPYRQMSSAELQAIEHQLLYSLGDGVITPNNLSYQSQMTELRNKLSFLEQQLQVSEELRHREKELIKKLEQFSWRDQVLYPNGVISGIVTFASIPLDRRSTCTLLFMVPPNQIVSVSFSLESNSN
ncbi:MAG: hypothetical protein AABZ14_05695 [Candidatus Margulisiibacteriota bacterium]